MEAADVFVHISAVEPGRMDGLQEGQKLNYELSRAARRCWVNAGQSDLRSVALKRGAARPFS